MLVYYSIKLDQNQKILILAWLVYCIESKVWVISI